VTVERRLDAAGGPPLETQFLYDGDALVAEYVAGIMTRRYVHNVGADVPLLSYQGATLGEPSYHHADHQGSIVAISGTTGAATINRYDEYGIPDSANTGRFQYTGQVWLAELGMYYYKARIYSPTLGRFLQVDPIGYQVDPIGYEDGLNLYAYVGNDPVNGRDPTGEACIGANGWSDYCRRAELYRRFDARFAHQTRFFAAASMTTTMLANLAIPVFNSAVSSETRSFMSNLSTVLERRECRDCEASGNRARAGFRSSPGRDNCSGRTKTGASAT
jgi:RHS repeat-associated protein